MNVFKSLRAFDEELFKLSPKLKKEVAEKHPYIQVLAIKLISEEYLEVLEAYEKGGPEELAKELTDLLYVTVQALVRFYGKDAEDIFLAVQRSNLSKFNKDSVVRADGKLLKSDQYVPPDLAFIKET